MNSWKPLFSDCSDYLVGLEFNSVCVYVYVSVSVSVSVCSKALSDLQAYVHLMGASQVTQWVKKPPAMQETQKM